MKNPNRTFSHGHMFALMLAASLALPPAAQAASLTLATAPLATSTTSTVLPNVMFMLDDSGSMDWDYMPDDSKNFAGNYGFNSAQCNGIAYNPNITYTPPLKSDGTSYSNSSFSSAWNNGYNPTGEGTVNLNTQFPGGSGTGSSGAAAYLGPAFYYTYSGTQTAATQKTIHNTNSVYYKECDSTIGSTTKVDGTNPVNTVFNLVTLATTPQSTLTVFNSAGGATITVSGSGGTATKVSSITVNSKQILNATTNGSTSINTVATNIVAGINACTAAITGNCTASGFSATCAGYPSCTSGTITVYGNGTAGGYTPSITKTGSLSVSATSAFPTIVATAVSGITVNGTQLMLSGATATTQSPGTLAGYIAAAINATGYSATASGTTVTITAPTSASNYTPVVTTTPSTGSLTVSATQFPESTPSKLQNFANWYSYYSTRMLMTMTGVGQAFAPINNQYRVGFMTMNNNVSPDFVDIAPFAGGTTSSPCAVGSGLCQKDKWYSKLYASNPGNSTPLRQALAEVGNLYAHKYGIVTTYTATITVNKPSGAGSTSVLGITVNGTQLLTGPSTGSSKTSSVAKNTVSNFIDPSQYTAVASGSTITITGPASASGYAPVVTDDGGGMTFTVTSFTGTATSAGQLNNYTPNDPIQYSCQQNFIILSTDGYWNGNAGYDVNGNAVGNQDGNVARPQYDGATGTTTVTTTYEDFVYSVSTYSSSNHNGCSSSAKYIGSRQARTETCSITTTNGVAGAENCGSGWSNYTDSAYPNGTYGTCQTNSSTVSANFPNPNPTTRAVIGTPVTTSGTTGGTSDTLADVAMYYANGDLRTPALNNCTGALGGSIDVCQNNVFKTATDSNTAQHMTTITLGLGASGDMIYSPSYLTDTTGDYYSVWKGLTADNTKTPPICSWQANGTTCNWPTPSSGSLTNIDDLWHAAVDGGGTYFSATDPASLASGLNGALATIASRKGAAAAAATSSLNPVAGNNYAYVASYTTVKWQGNLESRTIDTSTGVVSQTASWCVEPIVAGVCAAPATVVATTSGSSTTYNCVTTGSTAATCTAPGVFDPSTNNCNVPMAASCGGTMPAMVGSSSDTRTIYTANSGATALVSFGSGTDPVANASYATANATALAGNISSLTQWPTLTPTQQTAANATSLVSYLRGETGFENRAVNLVGPIDNRLYRYREVTLGDPLESQPSYIGPPVFSYADPGYGAFASANSSRVGTVYEGINDGMLHAFTTQQEGSLPAGSERWAYVPSMVIPNLWRLADYNYANMHTNYVNGSPVISDICTANCTDSATAVWRTILVGGLNAGGRGYFALDITAPNSPKLLWEFTTTAGNGSTKDDDLGYSYGNPVVTAKADGTWVVLLTSGYNNTSPGTGKEFLYVLNAATGAIISKIGTGVGSTTTPGGLAKISAWNDSPASNRASFVYGGDLQGNLWRFDINAASTPFLLATLDDPSGNPQPITTSPVLGKIQGMRVIFVGTGQYLQTADLSNTQVQTEYAIKDNNATVTLNDPAGSPRNSSTLVQQTLTAGNGVRTSSNNAVDWTTSNGWYVDFPDSGERANINGSLIQGTLLVATIVPSNTVCAPGGYGWLNYFDYTSGGSIDTTGVVSASYNNTIVGINVVYINGTPVIEAVTSNDPTPTVNPNVLIKGNASGFNGQRVLWRELNPQ